MCALYCGTTPFSTLWRYVRTHNIDQESVKARGWRGLLGPQGAMIYCFAQSGRQHVGRERERERETSFQFDVSTSIIKTSTPTGFSRRNTFVSHFCSLRVYVSTTHQINSPALKISLAALTTQIQSLCVAKTSVLLPRCFSNSPHERMNEEMREVENSCSIEQKQATRVAGGKSRWRGKFRDEIFACDWNAPRGEAYLHLCVAKIYSFLHAKQSWFFRSTAFIFKAGSKNDRWISIKCIYLYVFHKFAAFWSLNSIKHRWF